MKHTPNRPDIKNHDAYKKEIEQIFHFIYSELIHDETLTSKEFKEALRDSLNQALDIYESMKPYVLYNPIILDAYWSTWTWNDIWFESSEMWLTCNPDGYVENEMDKRINSAYLHAIESMGLGTQIHFHNLKSGGT